jgi:hypothetical protein
MSRIVVSIDPAISSEEGSNEHGIIVAGVGSDGRGYVLDDVTVKGGPQQWAERAISAYDRHEADAIVIEINQGGDMVRHTLKTVRPNLRIIEVRATRGKHVRAEPIAALYTMGKVSHVGAFPNLEDQLCLMTAAGYEGEGSPDRCLAWGTTISTNCGDVPIQNIEVGDMVLTRSGYRQVLAAEKTGASVPVLRLEMSNGHTLFGTDNHPIFVEGKGFIALDSLARDDILVSCKKKSLRSMVGNMFATRIRRTAQSVFTFIMRSMAAVGTEAGHSIGMFGNSITATSRMDTSYITETTTHSTTSPATLSASHIVSMPRGTLKISTVSGSEWTTLGPLQVHGTVAKKELHSTESLARRVGSVENRFPAYARNAVPSTKPLRDMETKDSALVSAALGGGKRIAAITRRATAWLADRHFKSSVQKKPNAAPVSVLGLSVAGTTDVFNITVEEVNEYYANGVLVHNCDALVWAMTELFPKLTKKTDSRNRRPSKANSTYSPHKWRKHA